MKRIISISVVILLAANTLSYSQAGKFLRNVKNAVQQEILGNSAKENTQTAPEPPSACSDAELIMEMGKYKIDYSELNIAVLSDGRILLYDKLSDSYYISKSGVIEGPMKENDQRVKQFRDLVNSEEENLKPEEKYPEYIKRQGDKFLISFGGKTYGPFGLVGNFVISSQRDKFAATVVENIPVSESEGKKMDAAIENAKTEAEKMQLAMQYAQMMQERIAAGGGTQAMLPKLVTNIPGAAINDATIINSVLKADMKYNEILIVSENTVSDLKGKPLLTLDFATLSAGKVFISSDNKLYATYTYGTLTISDGRKIQELFNPHLLPVNGKIYLAYMYFSPKRNAIMRCSLPF